MTNDLIARLEALALLWKPSPLTNVLGEAVAALTAQGETAPERAEADAPAMREALKRIVEFEPLKSGWDGWRYYQALKDIAHTALMSGVRDIGVHIAGATTAGACSGCGGPHAFDTSVVSSQWNAVIRAQGLPDYLCTTCIVRAFARAGVSFNAQLYGDGFSGTVIDIAVNGRDAGTITALRDENNRLRSALADVSPDHPLLAEVCRPASGETAPAPVDDELLTRLVRETVGDGPFKPFAIFDEQLDCIRVLARDCSTCETRIDERLTIVRDNYRDEQVVGFNLKGVAHFCHEHGLPDRLPDQFAALLNQVLTKAAASPVPAAVIPPCILPKGHEGPCEYAAAEFHDAQAAYALEDKYRDYERWASAGDRLERAWREVASPTASPVPAPTDERVIPDGAFTSGNRADGTEEYTPAIDSDPSMICYSCGGFHRISQAKLECFTAAASPVPAAKGQPELARLREWVRSHMRGTCHILTLGDKCLCPLCDLDRLAVSPPAAAEGLDLERLARETANELRMQAMIQWAPETVMTERMETVVMPIILTALRAVAETKR